MQNTKSKIGKRVSSLLLPIEANVRGSWAFLVYTTCDWAQIDAELKTR